MGSGRFGKIFEGYFLKGKENPYFKLISAQDVFWTNRYIFTYYLHLLILALAER